MRRLRGARDGETKHTVGLRKLGARVTMTFTSEVLGIGARPAATAAGGVTLAAALLLGLAVLLWRRSSENADSLISTDWNSRG